MKQTVTFNQLIALDRQASELSGHLLGLLLKKQLDEFTSANKEVLDAFRQKIKELNHQYFEIEQDGKTVRYTRPTMAEQKKGIKPRPILLKGKKIDEYRKKIEASHSVHVEIEI